MSDTAMSTGYMTPQELKEQERAAKKAERARLKRVEMDEKAERKRAAKSGFANVSNPRRSKLLTLVCAIFAVYCLFPFVYLPPTPGGLLRRTYQSSVPEIQCTAQIQYSDRKSTRLNSSHDQRSRMPSSA